jgi:hypothetical protein
MEHEYSDKSVTPWGGMLQMKQVIDKTQLNIRNEDTFILKTTLINNALSVLLKAMRLNFLSHSYFCVVLHHG